MLSPTFISLLQPDLVLGGCILKLTPEILEHYQLRGLVLDVDDTLVSTRARDVSPQLLTWLTTIRPLAQVFLVSNNISRARIQRIATDLDVPFVFGAGKPSRRKLRQVVDQMNLPPEQVAIVGDRLFTDVLVGNRMGLFTILVEPIAYQSSAVGLSSALRSFEIWLSQKLSAWVHR